MKLYDAFDGEGLARFDIRMEAATGKLMVLDVNPNCSLVRRRHCACARSSDPALPSSSLRLFAHRVLIVFFLCV